MKFDPKHVKRIKYIISHSTVISQPISFGFFVFCRYLLRLHRSVFRSSKVPFGRTRSSEYWNSGLFKQVFPEYLIQVSNVILELQEIPCMHLDSFYVLGTSTMDCYRAMRVRYCRHQYPYLLSVLKWLKGQSDCLNRVGNLLTNFHSLK